MACRIVMFHPDGRALCGLDAHHGDHHAAAWISDVVAQIELELAVTPIVVEYDPIAGGDDAKDVIRSLHELQLDAHARPDGRLELLGISRRGRHACRALRVLHAPADVAGDRRTIRNRGYPLAELAHDWRHASDAQYRRNYTRARRAREG